MAPLRKRSTTNVSEKLALAHTRTRPKLLAPRAHNLHGLLGAICMRTTIEVERLLMCNSEHVAHVGNTALTMIYAGVLHLKPFQRAQTNGARRRHGSWSGRTQPLHQHNQITSSARAFTRQRTQPHASVHARTNYLSYSLNGT